MLTCVYLTVHINRILGLFCFKLMGIKRTVTYNVSDHNINKE